MDDKENRAPSQAIETKRERMLQKLQRRNSATSANDFTASTAPAALKVDDSDVVETKALIAWINAVLTPTGADDIDAGGRSEVEALLEKDSCGRQLKEMLAATGRGADAKRDSAATVDAGLPSSSSSNKETNDMLQYSLKRASHANLARKLEALASDEILGAIQRLVVMRKIAIRGEVKVHTNLGVQTAICQALLSFQPVWLRLALEFVCGRRVQLPRGADGRVRYVSGMSSYILHNLIADYTVVEHNRKFCSGNNKRLLTDAGIDAVQKNFLAKLLCALYLIEIMLTNQLLPDVPCMFWPSSKFKSINDVLSLLSREVLSGGSALKTLQQAGFQITYHQDFFEEYKYVVKRFQTDLCDGVILAKIVEVLAARRGKDLVQLIGRLRNPSGDRLRKVYNVRYVLSECAAQFPEQFGGGQPEFNADDVVAGKRNVLVELVWRLIGVILGDDVAELRREFIAKYRSIAAKPTTADLHGLELPLLVEMRRLNAKASIIQTWWRRRRAIHAVKRLARSTADSTPQPSEIDQSAEDATSDVGQSPTVTTPEPLDIGQSAEDVTLNVSHSAEDATPQPLGIGQSTEDTARKLSEIDQSAEDATPDVGQSATDATPEPLDIGESAVKAVSQPPPSHFGHESDSFDTTVMLDRALKVTKNTIMARKIFERPRAQSDTQSYFPLTFEEFRKHLDDRRRDARYVGIPMRPDPLKAMKPTPRPGTSKKA